MSKEMRALVAASVIGMAALITAQGASLYAKHKTEEAEPNGPTSHLFQFLDSSRDGKLSDFYLLADLYKDPSKPDSELRHVLRVDYDRNRGFGKLNLWVRSVDKMTPQQLETYTPKQIFDFAETDLQKFVKTGLGPLGAPGDLYLHAGEEGPLVSAPVTDEVRKEYDDFVTQYILPALQKTAAPGAEPTK